MDPAPLIRDEVYRIVAEALRNVFRHAGAKRIHVRIHYDKRRLGIVVQDDGRGIDPQFVRAGGRTRHHGLPSMYERTRLVGGKLIVRSELDSGMLGGPRGVSAENWRRRHLQSPPSWLSRSVSKFLNTYNRNSAQIKTIKVHHLGPGLREVLDELLLPVSRGVDFGYGTQLGV
jgi:signal transduction histidine kinase